MNKDRLTLTVCEILILNVLKNKQASSKDILTKQEVFDSLVELFDQQIKQAKNGLYTRQQMIDSYIKGDDDAVLNEGGGGRHDETVLDDAIKYVDNLEASK